MRTTDLTYETEKKTHAAVKIQASLRGFFARQTYQLQQGAQHQCTDFSLMVQGNDPDFMHLIPMHASDDNVVLIGTSGLRTLEIACKLGTNLPKIFLIDNSQQVINFWRALKRLMDNISDYQSISFDKISSVFSCADKSESLNHDVCYFFRLCSEYGFNKIKRIILHASIVLQCWEDKQTFFVLKNLITRHQYAYVYVYPSNIVAYMMFNHEYESARNILHHVEDLNPCLAFHTDLVGDDVEGFRPRSLHMIAQGNHHADDVFLLLQPQVLNTQETAPSVVCQGNKVVVMDINDFFMDDHTTQAYDVNQEERKEIQVGEKRTVSMR